MPISAAEQNRAALAIANAGDDYLALATADPTSAGNNLIAAAGRAQINLGRVNADPDRPLRARCRDLADRQARRDLGSGRAACDGAGDAGQHRRRLVPRGVRHRPGGRGGRGALYRARPRLAVQHAQAHRAERGRAARVHGDDHASRRHRSRAGGDGLQPAGRPPGLPPPPAHMGDGGRGIVTCARRRGDDHSFADRWRRRRPPHRGARPPASASIERWTPARATRPTLARLPARHCSCACSTARCINRRSRARREKPATWPSWCWRRPCRPRPGADGANARDILWRLTASPLETVEPPPGEWIFSARAIDAGGRLSDEVRILAELGPQRLGDALLWRCPAATGWPGTIAGAGRSQDGADALEGIGDYTWGRSHHVGRLAVVGRRQWRGRGNGVDLHRRPDRPWRPLRRGAALVRRDRGRSRLSIPRRRDRGPRSGPPRGRPIPPAPPSPRAGCRCVGGSPATARSCSASITCAGRCTHRRPSASCSTAIPRPGRARRRTGASCRTISAS